MRYTIYKEGIPIHSSMTELKNPDHLIHVIINQNWTPLSIVTDYIKDPSLFTISEDKEDKPVTKSKRTRKPKGEQS